MWIKPEVTIYVADSDGSSLSPIIERGEGVDTTVVHSPTISPDGQRVAYSRYKYRKGKPSFFELESIGLDGTDRRRITSNDGQDFALSWSLDGTRIAFLRYDDYDACNAPSRVGIYTVESDGSDTRRVAWLDGRAKSNLAWSPNEQTFAFLVEESVRVNDESTAVSAARRTSLDAAPLDGSSRARLLTEPERWIQGGMPESRLEGPLAWAPDSSRVAFMWSDEELRVGLAPRALNTIGQDGDGLYQVAEFRAPTRWVSWSPDGSQLMVSTGWSEFQDIYTVDADGSNLRHIGVGGGFSWSPDGERVAIVTPGHNAIVLYTMATDGSDVQVLVRRLGDGSLEPVDAMQPRTATVASCSAGVVIPNPEGNPGLVRDCAALVRMIDRLAVVGLNWDFNRPISEWHGLTLEASGSQEDVVTPGNQTAPLRVSGLALADRGILGLFPNEVTELQILDLSGNLLSGTLPPALGRLANLRSLDLEGNNLHGPIPAEVKYLKALEILDLSNNNLGTQIPPDLGALSRLRVLSLSSAGVVGPLPPELGNLESLEVLKLDRNGVTGPLPAQLGNLSSLRELDLFYNTVNGPIPPEMGRLSALEVLDLRRNRLNGPIPPELGDLAALRVLNLSWNELSGSIPPELGNPQTLEEVILHNNSLVGCVPLSLEGRSIFAYHELDWCAP